MDLLDILKNKESVIRTLLKALNDSDKYTEGLKSMKERGFSQDGMLEKVIAVSAAQSQQIKAISLIALVYAQGGNFDQDVATALNKMGRGEEALRAMLDKKLKDIF